MATRDIIPMPHPVLRSSSVRVEQISLSLKQLAEDMLDTMYATRGVGLAAVQIGIPERIVVIDVAVQEQDRKPLVLINPEIVERSVERRSFREGCLSIPGFMGEVERPVEVSVRYTDLDGLSQTLQANGLMATCVQHEIDHLDGILFIDHLPETERAAILAAIGMISG
ncbi:peptide deformylase [Rhizobium aegyptiacum]|uniref:peptide deformylase n=1 Tax=Rhizobium aegyptiacum TaxID=1764550 RepID=UPI000AFC2625|nr:peptide deformylase [Rhizobium aegyptiacum]